MNALLLAAVLTPLALAAVASLPTRLRGLALATAPWAALPALLVAVGAPVAAPEPVPWLLLGMRLGIDQTGQVFLFFTALLWTVAGIYARAYLAHDPRRHRFVGFLLLTMCGNLGLIVAHDLVTFYVSFALMTFAAFPLVVHAGDAAALRAGRVYIVMAVLGETMLLVAFAIAAGASADLELRAVAAGIAASPQRDLIVGLLLAGFGVKAGALPLHMWLPLAHPVAPTPASAVLSGSMIKAGLLGWLRFLPLGEAALPGWAAVVIAAGLAAAFFGVLIGVTQVDPKTALAYSSISQMGIMNVAVGVGLANPAAWPAALAACLVYATHHGLAKGALFLGVGVAAAAHSSRIAWRLSLAGLALAALAVAGAPLSSGMIAKTYFKEIAPFSPAAWPDWLDVLLPLTAVGSTLLMGRFVWLVVRRGGAGSHPPLATGMWIPWAVLLGAVAGAAWIVPRFYELEIEPPALPGPGTVWVAVWPIIAGLLVLWIALASARRWSRLQGGVRVAPGDLLLLVERGLVRLDAVWQAVRLHEPTNPVAGLAARWYGVFAHPDRASRVVEIERRLTRWFMAGMLAVLLFSVLFALLVLG